MICWLRFTRENEAEKVEISLICAIFESCFLSRIGSTPCVSSHRGRVLNFLPRLLLPYRISYFIIFFTEIKSFAITLWSPSLIFESYTVTKTSVKIFSSLKNISFSNSPRFSFLSSGKCNPLFFFIFLITRHKIILQSATVK